MKGNIIASLILVLANAGFVLIACKAISGEFIPNGTGVVLAVIILTVSSWGFQRFFG
jgi:hypothetical protein